METERYTVKNKENKQLIQQHQFEQFRSQNEMMQSLYAQKKNSPGQDKIDENDYLKEMMAT